MQESGTFEYWFAWLFAASFCLWFPTYVIKTRGRKLPFWGLSFCVVSLFIFLPLLSVGLVRDVLPSLWLSIYGENFEAPSIQMIVGSIHKMATLDQIYVALAFIAILTGIGQSLLASWLLYIRHNRESYLRSIRLMWVSALMQVIAVDVLPLIILGKHGRTIVISSAPSIGIYLAVLIAITYYLRTQVKVINFYPPSHQPKRRVKK